MRKKKMINLVEVVQQSDRFILREIIVNPSHVVSVSPDEDAAALNAYGKLPDGLHPAQQFSKVKLVDGQTVRVVGNPGVIGDKTKKLLFG
jgi:hypothetical protein